MDRFQEPFQHAASLGDIIVDRRGEALPKRPSAALAASICRRAPGRWALGGAELSLRGRAPRQVREKHRALLARHHERFHPIWGQLLKTGYQNSRFAHQARAAPRPRGRRLRLHRMHLTTPPGGPARPTALRSLRLYGRARTAANASSEPTVLAPSGMLWVQRARPSPYPTPAHRSSALRACSRRTWPTCTSTCLTCPTLAASPNPTLRRRAGGALCVPVHVARGQPALLLARQVLPRAHGPHGARGGARVRGGRGLPAAARAAGLTCDERPSADRK